MMQIWYRALARKSLSGQKSSPPHRPARSRPVCLRLEAVEDRTLASATLPELPQPVLPPAESGGQALSRPVDDARPDRHAKDSNSDTSAAQNSDLIVESSPLGLFGFETPTTLAEGSLVSAVRDQRFTLDSAPAFRASDGVSVPSVVPGSLDIDRVASPAEEMGRPDKPLARRAGESTDAAPPAADAGRASATTTEAAPSSEPVRGATSVASVQPVPAAPGDRVTDNPTSRQRRPDPTAARPAQDDSDRTRPAPGGAGTASRTRRPADSAVSRAEANRLHAQMPDGSLLHRFVANREEAAFTALVQRHERLVLSVCQRVLGDWHAAQDALQTTFLVLARKAGMLDRQVPLTNWLYTVAYHAALRLRAVTARNRLTEAAAAQEWPVRSDGEVGTDLERLEIQQAVREELQNLPAEYREPLALCYVDGLTHNDAAREIGMPRGSMAKRLGEGLERLKERLVVRGISS
jgi:RNA polymerase sigma factor (sigma-70 family)